MEWKEDRLTLALAYDIGTENAADQAGSPRTFWMGGAFYARFHVSGPWSVAVRPEFYWDRNGRITGSEQLLTAVTSTVEYSVVSAKQNVIMRLEHRYDQSTGRGRGFFRRGEVGQAGLGLARDQQLFIVSIMWAFNS